jgi:hypothetical protein
MATTRLVFIFGVFSLLAGCTEEPPPRSVGEFLENRILLEATMVRCGENRNQSKYDSECVNAREAINRIAVEEEKARRQELEAQFERKRKSLRRTQEAAAEARRRAAEARRRQEEAEYLGVYDEMTPGTKIESALPPGSSVDTGNVDTSNVDRTQDAGGDGQAAADTAPPEGEAGQDLEAIREELRRRQDSN